MTLSQLEHLKLIDAHLERLLSIAEKRTLWVDRHGESANITSCNTNVESVDGAERLTAVHGVLFAMQTACENGDEKIQKNESSKKQDGLFVGSFQNQNTCKIAHAQSASTIQKRIEPNTRDENNGSCKELSQQKNCVVFGNATEGGVVIVEQTKYNHDSIRETREGSITLLPGQTVETTKLSTLLFAAKNATLQKETNNSCFFIASCGDSIRDAASNCITIPVQRRVVHGCHGCRRRFGGGG